MNDNVWTMELIETILWKHKTTRHEGAHMQPHNSILQNSHSQKHTQTQTQTHTQTMMLLWKSCSVVWCETSQWEILFTFDTFLHYYYVIHFFSDFSRSLHAMSENMSITFVHISSLELSCSLFSPLRRLPFYFFLLVFLFT